MDMKAGTINRDKETINKEVVNWKSKTISICVSQESKFSPCKAKPTELERETRLCTPGEF